MAVLKASDIEKVAFMEGRTRHIAYTDKLMVVVFEFEDGPHAEPDPPHSHPHEQITYVAEGELYFIMNGESTKVGPGDMITIPGNIPHSIQLITKKARLVDSFTPRRDEFVK